LQKYKFSSFPTPKIYFTNDPVLFKDYMLLALSKEAVHSPDNFAAQLFFILNSLLQRFRADGPLMWDCLKDNTVKH
jgi:hypothetical protein